MTDTVIVRLRYAVTGGMDAAKQVLLQNFLWNDEAPVKEISRMADRDNLHNAFTAKRFGVDVNPDEVSGYTNYETFHVALFLENNRDQYDNCSHLTKVALNTQKEEGADRVWLADAIQEVVEQDYLEIDDKEEECSTDSDRLAHSLLTTALGQVNWMEIADVFLTQAKENQDANV